MGSIQDGINQDKERNRNRMLNACKMKFAPEDVRQVINTVCFDPSPENISSAEFVASQMYRQNWYFTEIKK